MIDHGPHRPEETMSVSRFEALIDAYGAAAERWPAEERAAAQALLDRSAAARAARDAAARLDALLDRAPAEPPSAALVQRVLAAAPKPAPAPPAAGAPRRRRIGSRLAAFVGQAWPGAPAWQPATALATALLLGLVVGYAQPPFDTGTAAALTGEGTELLAFGAVSEPEVSP